MKTTDMKYLLLSLALIGFFSCTEPEVITPPVLGPLGEWEIVERKIDSGNGTIQDIAIDSGKTLSFYDDGTMKVTNGSLCDIYAESGEMTATYEEDKRIFVDCGSEDLSRRVFFTNEEDQMIVSYLCFETCIERYVQK